jgi:Icc-related predicted phosphoesterase
MRVALVSDLHFEFHRDKGAWLSARLPAAEVLVCAGNLSNAALLQPSLQRLCERYLHVVMVAGNHEFYGSSLRAVREQLAEAFARHANLYVLDNSTCEIDGRRFVGSTMWFRRRPGCALQQRKLNDFYEITLADPLLYEENAEATEFLERTVSEGDIVVTHHLPSMKSVQPQYAKDPLNCFFVCELDELIERVKPRYWLHGHTHSSCDYLLGETRVVCNPFGYQDHEVNPHFKEVFLEV